MAAVTARFVRLIIDTDADIETIRDESKRTIPLHLEKNANTDLTMFFEDLKEPQVLSLSMPPEFCKCFRQITPAAPLHPRTSPKVYLGSQGGAWG